MSESIAVAIITHNRPKALLRCLRSILESQNTQPNSVIVVENGSKSGSPDLLQLVNKHKNIVSYVEVEKRLSLPEARNTALKICETDIITFIDDDAEAKPYFIKTILEEFSKNENIIGVTGPTINVNKYKEPIEKIVTSTKKLIKTYPWGEVKSLARKWVPPHSVQVDGMQGGNMSYKTKDLKEIAGFDESLLLPSFREESDTQQSLKEKFKNGIIIYHPDVYVLHYINEEGGISDIEKEEGSYFFKAGQNHRIFADKHFPKFLSRASWILWSRNPPSLWLALILTIIRGKNYIAWHKGLWSKTCTTHHEKE